MLGEPESFRSGEDGLTLAEVLIAVVLMGIAALVVVEVLVPSNTSSTLQLRQFELERECGSAMEALLATDFMSLSPGTYGPTVLSSVPGGERLIEITAPSARVKQVRVTVFTSDAEVELVSLKGRRSF